MTERGSGRAVAARPAGRRRGISARSGSRRGAGLDVLLAGVLSLATLVVHDVGYIFSAPFWNDEDWVAISAKLPLSQIFTVTASTPVGWTFLLRLAVFGGDQRLRVIPLLFSMTAVAAAYAYVRSLPWPRPLVARPAAVMAGLAALLVPSALARNDLKQYTADAFVTLLGLWLISRLESEWTRRRLFALGVVVVLGFLFSAVSVFVGAAAFGCLVLTSLFQRNWLRTIESAVAGAASGCCLLAIFLAFYRPGIAPGLNTYWAAYYLPVAQGRRASWKYLVDHGKQLATYLGMGPILVALVLVLAGVVTLIRLRRPALALVVPALVAEAIVLGALKQYPLFDMRTSHFLTVALAVTAAIGVAGVCTLVARIHPAIGVVVALLAVGSFVTNGDVRSEIRSRHIPAEDLRSPTDYIAAHLRPDDVIAVGMLSSWGFAYYWPTGKPAPEKVTTNLQGFVAVFPDQPNILVATDRTPAAVAAVMDKAVLAARQRGPAARIWVVHDHVRPDELRAFDAAAASQGLASTSVMPGRLELLTSRAG